MVNILTAISAIWINIAEIAESCLTKEIAAFAIFQIGNIYNGPGPHWGTVRKKCPQVRYVGLVYYAVYILYR